MTNLNLNNNSGSANSPTYVNTSVPERGHAEVMNLTSTASPTSVVEVESEEEEEHETEEQSIYYEGPEFAHSNNLYAVPNRGESQKLVHFRLVIQLRNYEITFLKYSSRYTKLKSRKYSETEN